MDILIKDLTWIQGHEERIGDIRIRQGRIQEMGRSIQARKKDRVIGLANHYLYPGLINAHDHLHMNLYPHLGTPPYGNYVEWAKDIYKPNETPLREIESIPLGQRHLVGGIKNLISGVTTVIHHDPWRRSLGSRHFPIRVLKKYAWANSFAFDKKIRQNFPSRSTTPFIIHAAEGVDEIALREIKALQQLNVLKKNTVIVHGVALSPDDIRMIRDAGASLVWCPSSNYFMFGQTAGIPELRKHEVQVALGSDSTLTGPASLFDEMRAACKTGYVNAPEAFDMVTTQPAKMFNLPFGGLEPGAAADLLIAPSFIPDYFENLLLLHGSQLTAVFVAGELRFGDITLAQDLNVKLHAFRLGNEQKGIVTDVSKLTGNILKKADIKYLNRNPLWQLLTAG